MRVVKRETTSVEFVKWRVYHKQKAKAKQAQARRDIEFACDNPSMDQQYLAEVIRYLNGLFTSKLKPRDEFIIPFKPRVVTAEEQAAPPMTREEKIKAADEIAKMKMFAVLGTPANFEGFE